MYSIDTYIDDAQRKTGIESGRQLSKALKLSPAAVNYWQQRKTLPSDETMVRLATMGGHNVELALIYLNWWRAVSKDEHAAADHYLHMIESFDLQAA